MSREAPRSDEGPIDRCFCFDVPFARVLEEHRRTGATVEALGRRLGCGRGCGLCRPYLAVVLATGRTRLPVLTPTQCAAMARSARVV